MAVPRHAPPLLALAVALSCASPNPPPSARTAAGAGPAPVALRVEAAAPEDGATPEDCPVAAGVGLALLGGLDLPADARPTVSVMAGCQSGDRPGSLVASALVTLDVTTPGQPDDSFDGAGQAACDGCVGPKATGAAVAVARAVRAALDLALGQARVVRMADDQVVAILAAPESVPRSVLLAALEEAGARRLSTALGPATALLDSADDDVALRAVGVLGRLSDPSSVRALGRAALTKRPEVPFAAMRALADLDAPDAKRALELVAGQATDPVIAREALQLLREMSDDGEE